MDNLLKYLENWGKYKFSQKSFNEVDNLIFSQLAYTDFGGIVELNNNILLYDAAEKFYSLYSEEEIESLIAISAKSAKILKACANSPRYRDVKICNYIDNVSDDISKQFSATDFIIDDGTLVVAYRGTDVTVTGVKESAMLSYMFPVPAQIEALYFFQETAMRQDADIIICGHSKGGNLAVFAGVSCSNSLKKRIIAIYENDAPGFPKWFFDRYDYIQIKDKIHLITPESSVIGRMLYHDEKPIIVESSNQGLKQHSVSSWTVEIDGLKRVDEYDASSDFFSNYFNEMIDYVGDEDLEIFFDTLELMTDSLHIEDFYDLKSLDLKKAIGLINSRSKLDEAQKQRFNEILKKVIGDFSKEYISSSIKSFFEKRKQQD